MIQKETIFALSTCYGKSGIAIIKISGPNALKALICLNFSKNIFTRVATLGKIYKKNLDLIDEVIIIHFSKNNSYTGEETIELQTHGGLSIINSIFEELNSLNYLRLATSGEFTRMALENSKVSLNKVESLIDLINSEYEYQRKVAIRVYNGELENVYLRWKNDIIELISISEAYIDFSEDILHNDELNQLNKRIKKLQIDFDKNINFFKFANKLISGINICISGATNVGKSTMMNFLSQNEVSIISNTKGTTRDVVKSKIEILGMPVTLHDTAGIRATSNEIENIGIQRGQNIIKNSDIIIFMFDVTNLSDLDILHELKCLLNKNKNVLIYINKIDLLSKKYIVKLKLIKRLKKINIKYKSVLFLSLKTKVYRFIITQSIEKILNDFIPSSDANLITNIRHQNQLKNCSNYLGNALTSNILELKAEELRSCAKELGFLLGDINTEDILDKIFSSFCIGK